jgi:hypothetical protein
MGVDFSAKIFVGVELSRVQEPKTVKKYHEDTGQPYYVELDEEAYVIAGTKTIIEMEDRELPYEGAADLAGLCIDYGDSYPEYPDLMLGKEFCTTGSNRCGADPKPFELSDLVEMMAEVEKSMQRIFEYRGRVRAFLVQEIS